MLLVTNGYVLEVTMRMGSSLQRLLVINDYVRKVNNENENS
jgi:hypothetical protein